MMDANGPATGADSKPQRNILDKYTKDLSCKNPNAPNSVRAQDIRPNMSIQVNVNRSQLGETDFEVESLIEGSAVAGSNTLFKFDLTYAGVFRLQNIPEADLHPILMIECPRLMFPFARQIVADAVRSGGFPPLLIDPIDFHNLYRQRAAEVPQNLS